MAKIEMRSDTHSQEQIKTGLAFMFLSAVNELEKRLSKNAGSPDQQELELGEIGVNGQWFDVKITATPKKIT